MKYEFTAGDIAVSTLDEEPYIRIVRYADGWARASDPDDYYNDHETGAYSNYVKDIQPLFVLDLGAPDTDTLDMIRRGLARLDSGSGFRVLTQIYDQMEKQLGLGRPLQPLLFGAIVRDADGRRWVRESSSLTEPTPWRCESGGPTQKWEHFYPREILFPGVH